MNTKLPLPYIRDKQYVTLQPPRRSLVIPKLCLWNLFDEVVAWRSSLRPFFFLTIAPSVKNSLSLPSPLAILRLSQDYPKARFDCLRDCFQSLLSPLSALYIVNSAIGVMWSECAAFGFSRQLLPPLKNLNFM